MLSRVAESLYWMARYIERAEDISRLLEVNFNAFLDSSPSDAQQGWESIVKMNGDESLFAELFYKADSQSVLQFMFWEPLNSNSVVYSVSRARENARSVREQISTEMWEAINRLYFLTRNADQGTVLANPTEFLRLVRDGAQAFQGVTSATMTHGEPYRFIQLGLYFERADKTARILDSKYIHLNRFPAGSAAMSLQLIALLRSCSAFEPYRRVSSGQLDVQTVVEYLLLNHEFPRAALFCLDVCRATLDRIGSDASTAARTDPKRSLGRLRADLEFLDVNELVGEKLHPFLWDFLLRLNAAGNDIAGTYFSTSVILPDERPRQQQQQQQ